MNGDLQFVADTILIERALSLDPVVVKQAQITDLFTGALGGISDSIRRHVIDEVDTSSTGSTIQSVLKILEPAVLFRISPLLGILDVVAQKFIGTSITDIIASIVGKLKPTLLSGQPVDAGFVNSIGKSLLMPEEGSNAVTASDDLLYDLRLLAKNGQLERMAKLAAISYGVSQLDNSVMLKEAYYRVSFFDRLFGRLPYARRHNLLVGFVIWILKTVLLSSTLLTIGGVAADALGFGKKKDTDTTAPAKTDSTNVQMVGPVPVPNAPQVTGLRPPRGGPALQYMPNDSKNTWYVPVEGDPAQTLLNWVLRSYPQLSGYENIITGHPLFGDMVRKMSSGLTPDGSQIAMPIGFTRWVDVVNQFAPDVYRVIRTTSRMT